MATDQLKYFVPKIAVFENRIAEYVVVFEKRKRRKPQFAGQKTIINQRLHHQFTDEAARARTS
jgi:hypothetical protein